MKHISYKYKVKSIRLSRKIVKIVHLDIKNPRPYVIRRGSKRLKILAILRFSRSLVALWHWDRLHRSFPTPCWASRNRPLSWICLESAIQKYRDT